MNHFELTIFILTVILLVVAWLAMGFLWYCYSKSRDPEEKFWAKRFTWILAIATVCLAWLYIELLLK